MEKVYIRIELFYPPGREDIAQIASIELSPPTFNGSIFISVMDKTRVESQERSDWVLRKPYAQAFGFKNIHLLPGWGKKCSVSGFALLSR